VTLKTAAYKGNFFWPGTLMEMAMARFLAPNGMFGGILGKLK